MQLLFAGTDTIRLQQNLKYLHFPIASVVLSYKPENHSTRPSHPPHSNEKNHLFLALAKSCSFSNRR